MTGKGYKCSIFEIMILNEQVEVGTKLLIRAAMLVAGVFALYLLRDVVLVVLLALLTAAAFGPAIRKLERLKLSRTASVIIVYVLLLLGGITLLTVFVPIFLNELRQFVFQWPDHAKRLSIFLEGLESSLQGLGIDFQKEALFQNSASAVTSWVSNLFTTTVNLFQGLIHFIGYFFLALYLSLEEKGIEKFFLMLAPKKYHEHALSIAFRMQGKVSQWLFGQLLLMVIAFSIYFIGLSFLGVPYAFAIALFGGLMEILPYIGPVLAGFPAVIFGLLVSPGLGIAALLFYIVAHQMEAHIIAPQVMKRSADLSPVALIIAILVGLELAGPLGIILAVPLTMMLSVFVEDILIRRSVE